MLNNLAKYFNNCNLLCLIIEKMKTYFTFFSGANVEYFYQILNDNIQDQIKLFTAWQQGFGGSPGSCLIH